MIKSASNVISIAKDEVGYLEKKSNKNLDSKTANAGSNNYTKYNAVFGVNGCYWCCYFICWLFYKLCGSSKTDAKTMLCGTLSGSCETLRMAFKNHSRYSDTPQVGSLIFFKGTRHAGANHIGLVYKVTDSKVYTIEGNTSGGSTVVDNGGGVAKKSYKRSYAKIMGYGHPKYESDTSTTTNTSTSTKSTYSGNFPTLPKRGYYKIGDGYKTLTDHKTQVKRLQKLLNWILDMKLSVDGKFGTNTYNAVKKYQKQYKLTVDGEFGKASLSKAKTIKK